MKTIYYIKHMENSWILDFYPTLKEAKEVLTCCDEKEFILIAERGTNNIIYTITYSGNVFLKRRYNATN